MAPHEKTIIDTEDVRVAINGGHQLVVTLKEGSDISSIVVASDKTKWEDWIRAKYVIVDREAIGLK